MLTPQEVSARAFAKAMMGGYNMAAVDEFLDELTDDYTALYKENAELKAKLKVLVEKVEEYRATEDSMRATLLSAQRMADSIVQEAEKRRDQILGDAEDEIRRQVAANRQELDDAEERLRQGQQELARFIAASRELCQREVQFLDQLPKLEIAPPPPAAAEAEGKVLTLFPEVPEPQEPEPAAETVPSPEEPPAYPEGDPFAAEEEHTRRINLEELKFGRNYGGGQDN